MQGQRQIKANILIEINAVMHRLINKEKNLFTSGTCKIAKIQNPSQNTVYFINLNSFYYTLNKTVLFAKLEFQNSVSYLFPHFDNGLSALTFVNTPQIVHNFQEIVSNAAVLLTFEQAMSNPEFKAKIEEHCPQVDKEPLQGGDKIKSSIQTAGKMLGIGLKTLGHYLAQGIQTVGEYIDKKVEQPEQKTNVAPQTKQKWQTLKNGTSSAFNVSKQLYNKYLSPIVDVGLGYGKQVVQKIQTSQNATVKYARQLASTSGQAISTAVKGLTQGATEVTTQLGSQSRKIVNKKYGEDYVQTFLPEESGEKKETESKQTLKEKQEKTETKLIQTETQSHQQKQLYPKLNENKETDQK